MPVGTMVNPIDAPEVWDLFVAAGMVLPGVAKVTGASRKYKWDEKEGPGASGATHTYRGDRPAHFKVTIRFWLSAHFAEWAQIAPLLVPDPKKGIKAIDVFHPALEAVGISAAVVEEIGQPVDDGKGLWTLEIAMSEYKPPPKAKASGTPSGASSGKGSSGASSNAPPTAKTEQEKEIERLLAEAKKP